MYVEDLKKDFYEFLAGKRLFMIVHYDIDSICTCKIIQSLLKSRQTLYSLAVVQTLDELREVYRDNCTDVKHFLLINCGGTVNLMDELEAEDDVVFFVLDSHRPTDLCNIYSVEQVRLLHSRESDPNVPEFHDVFREDSEDEDEDENNEDPDEEEGRAAKRRRLGEEELLKRRERRLWEEKRHKLEFEYSQFSYYATASAISMFHLAWKVNKDDKDLLWLAIVALTEQMMMGKIENAQYTVEIDNLQRHVNRLTNRTNDTDVLTSLKIHFENDLRLVLYRHWSVEASLKYSMYTACKLKLWSLRGDKKLQELLADMGFPLAQSRQSFKSMDLQLRKEFFGAIEKLSERYGLDNLIYTSFTLQYGYRNKYAAADFVYILLAILECAPKEKKLEERFNIALDCLSRKRKDIIDNAVDRAQILFRTLFKSVQNALDMKQIITAGPFVYYIIQEGCLDWYMFSHLHILSLLAHFILRSYVAISRNRRASRLPLIVSTPKNIELGTCLLVGIPPLCEDSPKNFFGKAFEQASERFNCETYSGYFDTSYFEINVKDRTKFFDALTDLLT